VLSKTKKANGKIVNTSYDTLLAQVMKNLVDAPFTNTGFMPLLGWDNIAGDDLVLVLTSRDAPSMKKTKKYTQDIKSKK